MNNKDTNSGYLSESSLEIFNYLFDIKKKKNLRNLSKEASWYLPFPDFKTVKTAISELDIDSEDRLITLSFRKTTVMASSNLTRILRLP
jgi:hypothetical protein